MAKIINHGRWSVLIEMANTPSEYLVPWLQKVSGSSPSWLYRFWKLHEVWCFWRWWWWGCWWGTWEGHSQHPPWSPARWSAIILGRREGANHWIWGKLRLKGSQKTSKVLFRLSPRVHKLDNLFISPHHGLFYVLEHMCTYAFATDK